MGVFTASGTGSAWLTVITSCLLRPFRLDFFWVSRVISCASKIFLKNYLHQRCFRATEVFFYCSSFYVVYLNEMCLLPGDETDSLRMKRPVVSAACLWVFFHLLRSSLMNCPFFPSVPCRRSPTYSSISSAFSIDRIYLGNTTAQLHLLTFLYKFIA